MSDNDIIKALECHIKLHCWNNCPNATEERQLLNKSCSRMIAEDALDLINRQKAEIERVNAIGTRLSDICTEQDLEIERLKAESDMADGYEDALVERTKSEAIKEFAEKINEVFLRYAHLHSHAEGARKDYIETVDGKEIEMQSVWDVITLQMNGMAEYEEMSRLQKNIELIEKGRLLAELEKDFRLLVKEMTETPTKIEHNSLCETESYEVKE